jgi:hypothetical protein
MYITAAMTAILVCSTVAALPLPNSPLSPPEHDDFALQLLNSRKRVLEAPVKEKFSFLQKSEGPQAPHEKFSFLVKGNMLKTDGPTPWKDDGIPI